MRLVAIIIGAFLLLHGCRKKEAMPEIPEYDYIGIKYSDSSYKIPLDSFYVKYPDTLFFSHRFPLT
jgi:hypothetical protein